MHNVAQFVLIHGVCQHFLTKDHVDNMFLGVVVRAMTILRSSQTKSPVMIRSGERTCCSIVAPNIQNIFNSQQVIGPGRGNFHSDQDMW